MSTYELASMMNAFMGSLEFRWGPHDDEPTLIANKMEQIDEGLRDFELPLLASKEIVIDDMEERFRTESDPTGAPWEPRAPATIKGYERRGETYSTILKKTDRLYHAVTDRSSYDIDGNDLVINTSGWPVYWHLQNEGGMNNRGVKVPARPFLGLSETAAFEIIGIFDDWLNDEIDIIRPGVTGRTMFRGAFGRIHGRVSIGMARRPQTFPFGVSVEPTAGP